MNMTLRAILPTAFLAVLAASPSYADDLIKINTEEAMAICNGVSEALFNAVHEHPKEDRDCVIKMTYAGGYAKNASIHIQKGNYQMAIMDLLAVESRMRYIQMHADTCTNFAPLVTPYIPVVLALEKKLTDEVG